MDSTAIDLTEIDRTACDAQRALLTVPYMDSLGTINRSLHTGIDASLYSGFVEELPLPHRCVRTIMPILRSGFFNAEVRSGS